ncbi:acetate--CoA ligase family protein, partial [Dermatophilus congolensis]
PGTPLTLHTREDPVFGPIISLAPANPAAQLLGDTVYRIPPLTTRDTTSMLTELRSAPLLTHPNNTTGTGALADLIARISVLADFLPEIAHLTLDPINLRPDGIDVLGAHIHITPPATRSDPGRRTLT